MRIKLVLVALLVTGALSLDLSTSLLSMKLQDVSLLDMSSMSCSTPKSEFQSMLTQMNAWSDLVEHKEAINKDIETLKSLKKMIQMKDTNAIEQTMEQLILPKLQGEFGAPVLAEFKNQLKNLHTHKDCSVTLLKLCAYLIKQYQNCNRQCQQNPVTVIHIKGKIKDLQIVQQGCCQQTQSCDQPDIPIDPEVPDVPESSSEASNPEEEESGEESSTPSEPVPRPASEKSEEESNPSEEQSEEQSEESTSEEGQLGPGEDNPEESNPEEESDEESTSEAEEGEESNPEEGSPESAEENSEPSEEAEEGEEGTTPEESNPEEAGSNPEEEGEAESTEESEESEENGDEPVPDPNAESNEEEQSSEETAEGEENEEQSAPSPSEEQEEFEEHPPTPIEPEVVDPELRVCAAAQEEIPVQSGVTDTVAAFTKEVDDVNCAHYGFGFWFKWSSRYPTALLKGLEAPKYHLASVAEKLSVFVTQTGLEFNALNGADVQTTEINVGDIEGQLVYVYFSYANGQAVAITQVDDKFQSATLAQKQDQCKSATFNVAGPSDNNPSAQATYYKVQFSTSAFSAVSAQDEFNQFVLGCNALTLECKRESSKLGHFLEGLNGKVNLDQAHTFKQYYAQYEGEYSVSGWFRWTPLVDQASWHTAFRLTINDKDVNQNAKVLGDRDLALFIGNQSKNNIMAFTTYSYADNQGKGNPTFWQGVPYQQDLTHWHFIYFGYSHKLRKAYGFVEFISRKGEVHFPKINHYDAPQKYLYVGQDQFYPGYSGKIFGLHYNTCHGAYKELRYDQSFGYVPKPPADGEPIPESEPEETEEVPEESVEEAEEGVVPSEEEAVDIPEESEEISPPEEAETPEGESEEESSEEESNTPVNPDEEEEYELVNEEESWYSEESESWDSEESEEQDEPIGPPPQPPTPTPVVHFTPAPPAKPFPDPTPQPTPPVVPAEPCPVPVSCPRTITINKDNAADVLCAVSHYLGDFAQGITPATGPNVKRMCFCMVFNNDDAPPSLLQLAQQMPGHIQMNEPKKTDLLLKKFIKQTQI